MKMKIRKALRDLWVAPKKTLLAIVALILGIWGVGTVLVSNIILRNDLQENFLNTQPAHLILESEDFGNLNLDEFKKMKEIESLEFRDFSFQRIEIEPNVWVPLWLYGVKDFEDTQIAKIELEQGKFHTGEILVERDGLKVSGFQLNDLVNVRIANKTKQVKISGICFDPGQPPATQETSVYAYTDQVTYQALSGEVSGQRMLLRLYGVQNDHDVKETAMILTNRLKEQNIHVSSVNIPPFNRHPHQWQLNTILFIFGTIGLLAFALSLVLITQLTKSMLARQVQQIGVLKAIGAQSKDVFFIYSIYLLMLGALSGIIAVPLALVSGTAYSGFISTILNFNILTKTLPIWLYVLLVLMSLFAPLILSIPILWKATSITVKDALTQWASSKESSMILVFEKLRINKILLLAIRNALRNKSRSLITIGTMAIGVTIFSTGFSIKQALLDVLQSVDKEMQYDVQIVLNKDITRHEADSVLGTITKIESIEMWQGGKGYLSSALKSTANGIGIVALPAKTQMLYPKIISGRWLMNDAQHRNEVVLNQKGWELYGNQPLGSEIIIEINDKTVRMKIVGVVEQFDLGKVYMSIDEYDAVFNPEHLINTISIRSKNRNFEEVVELKKGIEEVLLQSSLSVASLISHPEKVKIIFEHLNIILSVILFLSLLVLVVSAIGMASSTSINILERTREIGVMRAIGATPQMIYKMFVFEGLIVSIVSIVLGLILSYPVTSVVAVYFGNLVLGERAVLDYAFSPEGMAITIVSTLFFAWLASRLPARTAIQVSVSKALAYE